MQANPTVTGTIWQDEDYDGVLDQNESVRANTEVRIFYDGQLLSTTQTNANGQYSYTMPADLEAGTVSIRVTAPEGYIFTADTQRGALNQSETNFDGEAQMSFSPDNLSYTMDSAVHYLDPVSLRPEVENDALVFSGSQSGRFMLSDLLANDRIYDHFPDYPFVDKQQPYQVILILSDPNIESVQVNGDPVDATRLELTTPPDQEIELQLSANDALLYYSIVTPYGSDPDLAEVPVSVDGVNTVPQARDDVLPLPYTQGMQYAVQPSHLLGNDSDAENDSWSGITIEQPLQSEQTLLLYQGDLVNAGQFISLSELENGSLRLVSTSSDYVEPETFAYTVSDGELSSNAATVSFETPLIRITGRVWEDSNNNGLQDSGESGMQNIQVILQNLMDDTIEQTRTNEQGQYSFSELWPLEYKVVIAPADGYTFTQPDAGDQALDSDVNAEGVSDLLMTNALEPVNTIDAGLVAQGSDQTAPVFSSADQIEISEEVSSDQVLYRAQVNEPADFQLQSSGDAGYFTIDSNGAVRLDSDAALEAEHNYQFTVVATDAAGNAATHTVTVSVQAAEPVQPPVSDDFTDDHTTTGVLRMDTASEGRIESEEDVDWFQVTLEQDQAYQFNLQGSDAQDNLLPDPYLRGIFDQNGQLLPGTTNDDYQGRNSQVTFIADDSGDYFVAAGAYARYTGDYQLSVELLGQSNAVDDYADDMDTLGQLAVDSSVTGLVETSYDRDWFQVELTADTAYQINLQGHESAEQPLADTYLYGVYDSDGQLMADTANDDFRGLSSQTLFTPQTSGSYYISAGAFGRYTGEYQLSLATLDNSTPDHHDDDFSQDQSTTGRLTVSSMTTGQIEQGGDQDWFRVTLQADQHYQFNQQPAEGAQGLRDPFIQGIYDSNGELIPQTQNDDFHGLASQVTFSPSTSGDYWIAAAAFGSYRGHYQLSMTEVDAPVDPIANDIAAGTETEASVAVGDSVSSVIDQAGDTDWIAIELQSGTEYRFDLQGEGGQNHIPLADTFLRGIYDSQGNLLSGTSNDDYDGLNSRVYFTPEETGRYFIEAGAYSTGIGAYQLLTMEAADPLNPLAEEFAAAPELALDQPVTDVIEHGLNRDFFQVALLSDHNYQINLQGHGDSNPLSDPLLPGIYDSAGSLIPGTRNDDFNGLNPQVVFSPQESGDYYIEAAAFGSLTGDYQLEISQLPAAEDLLSSDESLDSVLAGAGLESQTSESSSVDTLESAPRDMNLRLLDVDFTDIV